MMKKSLINIASIHNEAENGIHIRTSSVMIIIVPFRAITSSMLLLTLATCIQNTKEQE